MLKTGINQKRIYFDIKKRIENKKLNSKNSE